MNKTEESETLLLKKKRCLIRPFPFMRLTNFKRSHGNHRSSNFTLTCTSPSYVAGLIADSVLHCIALFQQAMRLLDREPQLLVLSVTTFKIDQNKNQNHSID